MEGWIKVISSGTNKGWKNEQIAGSKKEHSTMDSSANIMSAVQIKCTTKHELLQRLCTQKRYLHNVREESGRCFFPQNVNDVVFLVFSLYNCKFVTIPTIEYAIGSQLEIHFVFVGQQ